MCSDNMTREDCTQPRLRALKKALDDLQFVVDNFTENTLPITTPEIINKARETVRRYKSYMQAREEENKNAT